MPDEQPDYEPSASSHPLSAAEKSSRLRELAEVFLRLGTIAFGGPAAHIAMMEQEVVQKRRWMSREKLLDLLGITSLIPGPNSTELAIHLGYERAGVAGLMVAGCCFILPAMLIVWALAIAYARYQTLPQLGWLLYGIKPVIIAIVLQALWKLGRTALKDTPTRVAAIAVIVLFFLGWNEIALLILAGLGVMLVKVRQPPVSAALLLPVPVVLAQTSGTAAALTTTGWPQIFLIFLRIGSVLYGSGYVLLAFLQRDLVERLQLINSQQLLDAIAIGQFTPGPVFTTATFIGYLIGGNAGAIAATIGIFLPAFVLVLIVNPWASALRRSRWASGFLDGVNAASLGLMAVVTWTLARSALVDWLTIVLAVTAAVLIFRFKVNSTWLVVAGGVIGFLSQQLL